MILSEHQEACILADWLRLNGYAFHHSPNETYTTSWNQKRKNTQEGVSKWFPDYTIILKRGALLFIELKKSKWKRGGLNWSQISEEQKQWIENLSNVDNVAWEFAFWAEHAIEIIESYDKI